MLESMAWLETKAATKLCVHVMVMVCNSHSSGFHKLFLFNPDNFKFSDKNGIA